MANEINLEIACTQVFGITSRQYRMHAQEKGAPPVVKGQVDILKASKYLIEYYRALAKGQGSLSLTDERTRDTRLAADIKEEKLKILRKEYVNAKTVLEIWQRYIRNCLTNFLSISSILAPELALIDKAPEIKKIIEDKLHDAANELKRFKLSDIRIDESSFDVETSTKSKSKRMGGKKRILKSRIKRKSR